MNKILIMGLVLTGLILGCSTSIQPVQTDEHSSGQLCAPETTAPVTQTTVPVSQLGQKVRCAVMPQNEFTVISKTATLEYQGKRYYFCCGGCLETFKKNPEKYIKSE